MISYYLIKKEGKNQKIYYLIILNHGGYLVNKPLVRFELTTFALQVRRSNQLSYNGDSHTGTRTRVGWVKTSYPNHLDYMGMVVAVGFEPTKHDTHELESCPVDRLGTLPYI